MFYGCTYLTVAPDLPYVGSDSATYAVGDSAYSYMFANCTRLTTPPTISAVRFASTVCEYMFQNCTSLTTTAYMSPVNIGTGTFRGMYYNCTALTTINVGTIGGIGYSSAFQYMFYGCTSLNRVLQLPATSLNSNVYNSMYYGCTSLGVYTTSGTGHTYAYRLPTSGTFTTINNDTLTMTNMFGNIKSGSTAPASPLPVVGEALTYYVEYPPV